MTDSLLLGLVVGASATYGAAVAIDHLDQFVKWRDKRRAAKKGPML